MFTNSENSDIINIRGDETINNPIIDSPIDQRNTGKGNPNAILHLDRPLNDRQQKLLYSLGSYESRVTVSKKDVNMKDLSALTAATGDEFAMFTKGQERLIIRGDSTHVNVDKIIAKNLNEQGYKWSGHTHPGYDMNVLGASDGDYGILDMFSQNKSSIYNSKGQYLEFNKD